MNDFTSEPVLAAHIGFLRPMTEAMTETVLPARSEPIEIAVEARIVKRAVRGILARANPETRTAIWSAVGRVQPACRSEDAAFMSRVADVARRILHPSQSSGLRPASAEPMVEVFALWTVVSALVAANTSVDRLRAARATADHALAVLASGADAAAQLSARVQVDFYDACLDALTKEACAAKGSVH